ncbi:hypothetical protein H9L39_20216, partial [Fusarium oxysporum f. sp. albedinis]
DLKHVALINKRLSSCVAPSLFHQLSIDEDGIQKLLENHEHKKVTDHVKVLKIYPRTYDLFVPGSALARLATSWKSGNFAQHPIQEILISVKGEEKPQDLVSVMSRFTCLKKLMVRAMSLDLPSQLIWPSLEHFEFEHILGIEQPMEIDPDRLKRCFEKHKQLKTEGPDVTFIFRPMPLIESALQGAKIEIGNYSERVYGNGGDLDKFHKLYHDSVGGRFSLFVKAQPHTPSRSPVTRTFI